MDTNAYLASMLHRSLLVIHASLATAILVGGAMRFPPPTYQPLLDMTHGHAWPWAIGIGLSAILMLAHNQQVNMVGTFIGMVWMYMFASMFAVAVAEYPDAGATAPVAYFGLGLLNAILLTHYVILRRQSRGEC